MFTYAQAEACPSGKEKGGKRYDFPDKQETMAWMSFDADILLSDFFVMTIINGRNKKAKEADNIF